jgi:hypothetical protein
MWLEEAPQETSADEMPSSLEPAAAEGLRDRERLVDAYIDEVFQKTGKTKMISGADIWKAAGDKDRTEFERWKNHYYERHGKKTNQAAHDRFIRVLREKPHLK